MGLRTFGYFQHENKLTHKLDFTDFANIETDLREILKKQEAKFCED
jgi:hypothetical protein